MLEYKNKIEEHLSKYPKSQSNKNDAKLISLRNNQSINECHQKLYQDQSNNIKILQEVLFVFKTMNDHLKLNQKGYQELINSLQIMIDDQKQNEFENSLNIKRKRDKIEIKEDFAKIYLNEDNNNYNNNDIKQSNQIESTIFDYSNKTSQINNTQKIDQNLNNIDLNIKSEEIKECLSPKSDSNISTCNSLGCNTSDIKSSPKQNADQNDFFTLKSPNINNLQNNYKLKFPSSISNSKSMFINVSLIILCVFMILDIQIVNHESNQSTNITQRNLNVKNKQEYQNSENQLNNNKNQYNLNHDQSHYSNIFLEKIKDKAQDFQNEKHYSQYQKNFNNDYIDDTQINLDNNDYHLINNSRDIQGEITSKKYLNERISYQKSIDINFFQNLLLKRCREKIQSIKNNRFAVIHPTKTKYDENSSSSDYINSMSSSCSNQNSKCPFNLVKYDGQIEFSNLSSVLVHDGQFKLAPAIQRVIRSKHDQYGQTALAKQSGFENLDHNMIKDSLKNQQFQLGYIMKDNAILEILGMIVDVNVYME